MKNKDQKLDDIYDMIGNQEAPEDYEAYMLLEEYIYNLKPSPEGAASLIDIIESYDVESAYNALLDEFSVYLRSDERKWVRERYNNNFNKIMEENSCAKEDSIRMKYGRSLRREDT